MAVAPQITQALDDVAPQTGEVQYGEYTNDRSPVLRVSLGDQAIAGETLALTDNGGAIGSGVTGHAYQSQRGLSSPSSPRASARSASLSAGTATG